jgi:sugar lactone lactonase YvrE
MDVYGPSGTHSVNGERQTVNDKDTRSMSHAAELVIDARATLGEGPLWHASRRQLVWVDIEGHDIHLSDPDTGADERIHVAEHIGCVVAAGDDLLVLGLRSGFAVLDLAARRRVHIEDPEHHLPDNRFNDGKCDPAGRLWAGTMAIDESHGAGALYRLDPDLTVHLMIPSVSISNGLDWSLDHRTMYYVDSPTRRVVAYDYDERTGAIGNPRAVFQVPEDAGFPDGMSIDEEGCLWIALWNGARVIRLDPARGEMVDRIDMPVSRPSSCAFGGADLDELFITSASNLPPVRRAREPQAGGVFRVRPGVRGLPAVDFAGAARLRELLVRSPGVGRN